MTDPSLQATNLEEEVWNAIAAFEQILEAMPDDRASLEALCHAYEQIGDHTRAKDYVIRLADVLVGEGDGDAGQKLLTRLESYSDGDDRVAKAVEKLTALSGVPSPHSPAGAGGASAASVGTVAASPQIETFSLAEELSFAWSLLEQDLLTQEEYGSLVQDLTELSSSDGKQTISVLHALEVRGFKGLERVMSSVSKNFSAPLVSLSYFDIPRAAISVLPLDFMVRRGVLPFDFVANDLLVVLMNPYDKQLRQLVAEMSGRQCHFYMALPSDFDRSLTRIRELLLEQ